MKVYIINYDNGEAYEDYNEWLSDVAYTSIEKCEEVLLTKGFTKYKVLWMGREYWVKDMSEDQWDRVENAEIIELEVV